MNLIKAETVGYGCSSARSLYEASRLTSVRRCLMNYARREGNERFEVQLLASFLTRCSPVAPSTPTLILF
jgi:hypothetical protein